LLEFRFICKLYAQVLWLQGSFPEEVEFSLTGLPNALEQKDLPHNEGQILAIIAR
jgi:hypothetical protein